MRLWRIVPAVPPDDPRWLGGPIWREIIVRAESAAEARVIASRMDADVFEYRPDRNSAGAQAMDMPSALYDETLYEVLEIPAGATTQFTPEGPREILVAHRSGTA